MDNPPPRLCVADGGDVWFKGLISFVLKLLIAIAPVFAVPLLLKEEKSHPWLVAALGTKEDKLKDAAIAALTTIDVVVLSTYELLTRVLPQRQAKRVADVYVESLIKQFEEEIKTHGMEMGSDIRINVMFVRRSIFTFFMRRFVWFANRGFEGGHGDNGLWLFTGQGLCGRAFKEKKTLSVDLRGESATGKAKWLPCRDNFWMLAWQRRCTAHLKAILTIPIFAEEKIGQMTYHTPVGVINIDAVSDQGAEGLLSNKKRLDGFFKDSGKILALLAPR